MYLRNCTSRVMPKNPAAHWAPTIKLTILTKFQSVGSICKRTSEVTFATGLLA